jgi:hypothetical protein
VVEIGAGDRPAAIDRPQANDKEGNKMEKKIGSRTVVKSQ